MDPIDGALRDYEGNKVEWLRGDNPLMCTSTLVYEHSVFHEAPIVAIKCTQSDPSTDPLAIVDNDNDKFWLAPKDCKMANVDFRLETPVKIDAISILNKGTPVISILVGNSKRGDSHGNKMLLKADLAKFHTEADMYHGPLMDSSRFFYHRDKSFKKEIHAQDWDLVRLVCMHPYKVHKQPMGLINMSIGTEPR